MPVRTGVCPIAKLEYDIDIGLRFPFAENAHSAGEVRRWVLEAVDGHTDSVEEMGPCIRVTYTDGYHVDLVSYTSWADSGNQELCRLAHRTKGWCPADPPALLEYIRNARKSFEGTEDSRTKTDQLRRVVRYLKRWYDVAIPIESDAKPTGLAFLLLAIAHLSPTKFWDGVSDDRAALFSLANCATNVGARISIRKPTPEYEDVFGKLSEREMSDLKDQFRTMAKALNEANRETDPVVACKLLQAVFGDDFPVPDPEDTGKKTAAPAIVTSSSSA
ncbi:MAG: hypothetical protein HY644_04505 [Acidobacteria bacterium]|nr:hypothetical protein [Acidobacteriota bacterium]